MMTHLSPNAFFDLSQYKHAAIFDGCAYVWEALKHIETYLKNRVGKIEVEIPHEAYLDKKQSISIGKGTVVEPGAYIRGPCIIGENCTIRHGAYIRGGIITGDNCVIGHDTEVKNSIFLNEAHAAHFAYVGDSILGNGINLGAGTKCANLKLRNDLILVHDGDNVISTGLRKLGAIVGDRSQLGCNSVTNPGTIIGKDVLCYPCINLGGVIPSNSIVKSTSQIVISQTVKK